MASINNGFPTTPKRIRAADNYLAARQPASESEFVNAIVPEDILPSNWPNGFSFFGIWT
jgi:hypothetical protein